MSLFFSYKNLSAPRAPRRFNNSLGQQFLYFLPNKLHVNQIKSPGGSRCGANIGVEKLEQTRWLYVGSSNSTSIALIYLDSLGPPIRKVADLCLVKKS